TEWLGLSPTFWLILGGAAILYVFTRWELHVVARGDEPLVQPGRSRTPGCAWVSRCSSSSTSPKGGSSSSSRCSSRSPWVCRPPPPACAFFRCPCPCCWPRC